MLGFLNPVASFSEDNAIQNVRVTDAAMQDLQISGLDGDADGEYFLRGRIVVPANNGSSFDLRPNGVQTDLVLKYAQNGGAMSSPGITAWTIQGTLNVSGPVEFVFRAWIVASRTVNGVASWRTIQCWSTACFTDTNGNDITDRRSSGIWAETATNLTSANLVSSVAGGIGIGSQILAWRAPTSFGI